MGKQETTKESYIYVDESEILCGKNTGYLMKVWNISLTNFLWNVCRKKEAVIFIDKKEK